MSSYRADPGIDTALEEISKHRAIWFDEQVVECCLELFEQNEFSFE